MSRTSGFSSSAPHDAHIMVFPSGIYPVCTLIGLNLDRLLFSNIANHLRNLVCSSLCWSPWRRVIICLLMGSEFDPPRLCSDPSSKRVNNLRFPGCSLAMGPRFHYSLNPYFPAQKTIDYCSSDPTSSVRINKL